jgi:endonuclease/exonuclease/phosphatase family metal-dependent hydrolase
MTWNLWWRFGPAWRDRQYGILSVLDAIEPDVLGLQEVWGDPDTTQAEWLAEKLGMHSAYAAPSVPPPHPAESPDHTGVEVGVAVLSRWPISTVAEHRMPSGHRSEVVALAVVVDHPLGPLHLVTSCLDRDRGFGAQRLAQAEVLAALAGQPARDGPLPVIVTGDLNAPPDTPEVRTISAGMVDAWIAGRGTDEPGHTLSTGNPLAPRAAWQIDHRIDYIFARPGRPDAPVAVERSFLAGHPLDSQPPDDHRYASDHYAVVADLRL